MLGRGGSGSGLRGISILLFLIVITAPALSGCLSLMGEDAPRPSADLQVWPSKIQAGESVTLDARSSEANEGVLTKFTWDFGDGSSDETLIGFTSHRYNDWGRYEVVITVENDRGGTDSASAEVEVNGAPVLNLNIPEQVKAGDIAVFDASESYDPEGGTLEVVWDLDWGVDSDDDGDSRNDVDNTSLRVEMPTSSSGQILGSITIIDLDGGSTYMPWTLDILTRRFQVEWTQRSVEVVWDGYLEQGATWSQANTPGEEGQLISVYAVLELDRDLIEPQDNFSLTVEVVEASWSESVMTTSDSNITSNESAKAEIQRDELNQASNDSEMTADTAEALLHYLLNPLDSGFGQGQWMWSITAEQADPDAPFGIGQDPDSGNEWTLTVTFVIMVPTLTEIAQ